MTTVALRGNETNLLRIVQAVRDLQKGRNNAHGEFTLNDNNSDTSLTVPAVNCAEGSHVSVTPTTANAAAAMADIYIVAGDGEFTVNHAATSNDDETFTYGIVG